MLHILRERYRQKFRTMPYPSQPPAPLPDAYRGLPVIDRSKCPVDCRECIEACPTDALSGAGAGLKLDLGRCLFCTDCIEACPTGAIAYTTDYRMATRTRADLVVDGRALQLAAALDAQSLRIFGRSLKLRQVSAGGCNGCEADVNVLNTIVFDLGRFGVQFVASPRHADGLLITGPVTQNMKYALEQTDAATPAPKFVIAVGACAISGGPYIGHAEQCNGADSLLKVDLYIPGCPPHPMTILDGILRLLDRLEPNSQPTTSSGVSAPTVPPDEPVVPHGALNP